MRKILGFLLLFCAYALLVPGVTQPMLSVSGTVEKTKLVSVGQDILRDSRDIPGIVKDLIDPIIDNVDASGTVPAFSKTNSILSTATELYSNNHVPVAGLILLFSVGIPLLKVLLLIAAHLPFRNAIKQRLLWVSAIPIWQQTGFEKAGLWSISTPRLALAFTTFWVIAWYRLRQHSC